MNNNTADPPKNWCMRCKHHVITHEPRFPYACRALGFKSAQAPYRVVEAQSGMHCQMFEPKNKQ